MKTKKLRVLTIILSILLMTQSMGFISFAASDLKGHWSETKVTEWINKGFITGYPDGTFKPNAKITRAEFMSIANKAYGLSGGSAVYFKDVKSADWYHSVIATAVANGYIGGYPDGTMKPNAPISRGEAAVIITKIAKLTLEPATANFFTDASSIPSWALGAVGAVAKNGVMSGYTGGVFGANRPITRAETVIALSKAFGVQGLSSQVYDVSGTYGSSSVTQRIQGDVLIKASQVNLRNMRITGNLTIDKAVGSGNVSLSNIEVQGQIYVKGGGTNSVYFDNVIGTNVYVSRAEGAVRIVATGTTRINNVIAQSDVKLEENSVTNGGFLTLRTEAGSSTGIDIGLTTAKLDSLELKGKGSTVDLDSKTIVSSLNVSGTSNVINTVSGAVISDFTADAAVVVSGVGEITKAQVNASGVSFGIAPLTLKVKSGVSQPTITGSAIESWTPSNGSKNAEIDGNIVIKFSDKVRLRSGNTALTSSNVDALINLRTKNSSGTKVPFDATVSTSSGKTIITINPSSDLTLDQIYYVSIDGDALEDEDDNRLTGTLSITFTTLGSDNPVIRSFDPANNSENVSITQNIVITFSEKVRLRSGNTELTNSNADDEDGVFILKKSSSSGSNVNFDTSVSTVSGRTVITIKPESDLSINQVYYVALVDNKLEDFDDNLVMGTKFATFKTAGITMAPTIETFVPANNATGISTSSNITMTFNKEVRLINDSVLTSSNVDALITLKETNSSGVSEPFQATMTVAGGKTVVTIDPTATLKSNQVYYIAISGLEDSLNQALVGVKAITFTTATSGAPTLESYSPVTNGALDSNVLITFSKEVRATDDTILTAGNVVSKLGIVLKKSNGTGADIPFVATVSLVNNKTVITLNPTPLLEGGSTYYVAFDNIEDTSNQGLIGSKNFTFSTMPIVVTGITVTGTGNVSTITAPNAKLQMLATVVPANATDQSVTWTVVPTSGIATIGTTGLLTPVSNGSVTVHAISASDNAIRGSIVITITNQALQPTSVTVTGEGANMIVEDNGTLQLVATIAPLNVGDSTIAWSIESGAQCATVSASGKLTAIANGTVRAKATAHNGVSGIIDVVISGQTIEVISMQPLSNYQVNQNDGKSLTDIINAIGNMVTLNTEAGQVNATVVWNGSGCTYANGVVGLYELTGAIVLPAGYGDQVSPVTASIILKVNAPNLESISVTTPPSKLIYAVGEAANYSGIVITGIYNFGGNQEVTSSANYSGFDSTAIGTVKITVTVGTKTTTFDIMIQ